MRSRWGFSLAELMMTVAVASIALAAVMQPAANYLTHTRVNKAADVVAGDFGTARSIAMRAAQPVSLVFDSDGLRYTIRSRDGATVFLTRDLGTNSDFKLRGSRFSPSIVTFFPNGVTSSPVTATLGDERYSRRVTMSRVGLVRQL